MTEENTSIPSLPSYQSPQGLRMAEPAEQKPLIKMLNRMLQPQKLRHMKMSENTKKKKHQVKFY